MNKVLYGILLFLISSCADQNIKNMDINIEKYSLSWAQDLIIYEVAPKSFTSPDGPGSGTFNSTKDKIPYLADLGINGIWLTGHNWANDHFYNIWTQYAAIRQDSIDPGLGTPQDFKELVEEAHKHDIKVFLDVITHGVVNTSPLIKEHPDWFKKGSWGMTDFDYFGDHPDFEKWWVDLWLRYILEFGVDGFRIDCDIYRPDLWNEIRKKAFEKGKEIVIFSETAMRYPGMTDSRQFIVNIASHDGLVKTHQFISNPAKHLNKLFNFYNNDYSIELNFKNSKPVLLKNNDKRVISVNHRKNEIIGEQFFPYKYFVTEIRILLKNNTDSLVGVKTTQFENGFDHYEQNWWVWANKETHQPNEAKVGMQNDTLVVFIPEIPPQEELTFLQISCHDGGWEGFPKDENPYSVQGSRCIIGYSGLLTPTVPIIFMGEEFDADYHSLPKHKGSLYGDKGKEGEGRWMYAQMLDWNELKNENHKDMLNDVKNIIDIRKNESDLFNGWAIQSGVKIEELEYECDDNIPVPFIIWNKEKAIIVAGNNLKKDVEVNITIPEKLLPFKATEITDLWLGKEIELSQVINLSIRADKTAKGGLAVLKIQ